MLSKSAKTQVSCHKKLVDQVLNLPETMEPLLVLVLGEPAEKVRVTDYKKGIQ